MGCCQSKLLGVESQSQKYQSSVIGLNSAYVPNKKMIAIQLARDEKPRQNTDRCSIGSLKFALQNVFDNFQKQKGPITYTCLQKPVQFQAIPTQNILQKPSARFQPVQKLNQERQEFSNTYFSSKSNQTNELKQLWYPFDNSEMLKNSEINTSRILMKELFYINSNEIGDTKLLKWNQHQRTPFILKEDDIRNLISRIGCTALIGSLLLICYYQQKNDLKLLALKNIGNGVGLRVFINGIKRMLKLKTPQQQIELIQIFQVVLRLLEKLQIIEINNWIYVLTGWVPQSINLKSFDDNYQIFKRLVRNFENGNIIISFTKQNSSQHLLVKNIDFLQENIQAIRYPLSSNESKANSQQQKCLNWTAVTNQYCILNVNWNPQIYSFTKKIQGSINLSRNSQELSQSSNSKILIKIPASKTEVEVRFLVQIHQTNETYIRNYVINLYEKDKNILILSQTQPIRKLNIKNQIFASQIFIFEHCNDQSQYIMQLKIQNQSMIYTNEHCVQFTVDFYTFIPIKTQILSQSVHIDSLFIASEIRQQNAGFGMNSPFFNQNIKYSLKIVQQVTCRINVNFKTQHPMTFQLCILPDEHDSKDITLVRPEQFVKDIIQSDQFQEEGIFQFCCGKGNYVIILVCFTRTQGQVQINIQNYAKKSDFHSLNEIRNSIQQIRNSLYFIKQLQFEWSQKSIGPRKRTKSNCEPIEYPISTFDKFFQNPYHDEILPRGFYQFSVFSKTFVDSLLYDDCQYSSNDKQAYKQSWSAKILCASPPSLSMAIYKLNSSKTTAKIVLDDFQYVPYGMGFWSGIFELEGLYRFIFPKIEKAKQIGIFKIRKIDQF